MHLNFAGNYTLARAVAEQAAHCLPSGRVAGQRSDWPDEATCARRLALTDCNRQTVLEEIRRRLADAPFSNQAGHEARLERLEQQLREIQARLRSSSPQGLRVIYEEALKSRPHDQWLHHNYAEYLTRIGEWRRPPARWRKCANSCRSITRATSIRVACWRVRRSMMKRANPWKWP